MTRNLEIAAHYPDDLPVDIVIGATSQKAQYTVRDLRDWARAALGNEIEDFQQLDLAAIEARRANALALAVLGQTYPMGHAGGFSTSSSNPSAG